MKVKDEDGREFELGQQVAYRGKVGCTNFDCTRGPGWPESCYGWHCSVCDEPCSMMGHTCKPKAAA